MSVTSDTTFDDDISDDSDGDAKPSSGMANVIMKLLAKTVPEKKGPILCKGKTDKELAARKRKLTTESVEVVKRKKEGDVISSEEEKIEEDIKVDIKDLKTLEYSASILKKKVWEEMGRVKPGHLDREAERNLQRIAAKGVVQLFNAVKKQQSVQDDKQQSALTSTQKKGKFIDLLKSSDSSQSQRRKKVTNDSDVKLEIKEEDDSTWSILRDDFMLGSTMKDWDKEATTWTDM